MIDIFARAAHAPQTSVRVPPWAIEAIEPVVKAGLTVTPLSDAVVDRVLADFGIPRSVLVYVNYPTHFDSRQTEAALEGTGITVPPLEAYAGKLWDYWERHLDPDLFRDRTLIGAARGRLGPGRRPRPDPRAADPRRAHAARPPDRRQRLAAGRRARAGSSWSPAPPRGSASRRR